jgi:DNA adenine methylase
VIKNRLGASVPCPLKWHGGKHYLAPKIVALMPPHLHYVEPFFGGGAVLLAKSPDGVSEVVNDLDGDLINFWQVLADEASFSQLQRRLEATAFSEAHWHEAVDAEERTDQVDRAVSFFIRCRQSLAGRMDSFAPISRNRVRRGMNEQASAWLTAVEGLPAVHARLKRVVIVGPKDAKEVIQQQDGPNTLFYLDPPYLDETRTAPNVYRFEMTRDQHTELLDVLKAVKGKVMLSGYDSVLYQEKLADWNCHAFELPNNAASGQSKRKMTEIVWCNF